MGIEQKLEDLYPNHFDNGEPILWSEAKSINAIENKRLAEKAAPSQKEVKQSPQPTADIDDAIEKPLTYPQTQAKSRVEKVKQELLRMFRGK